MSRRRWQRERLKINRFLNLLISVVLAIKIGKTTTTLLLKVIDLKRVYLT